MKIASPFLLLTKSWMALLTIWRHGDDINDSRFTIVVSNVLISKFSVTVCNSSIAVSIEEVKICRNNYKAYNERRSAL